MSTGLKVVSWIVGVLVVLGLVAAFVMFGPPHVAERLARPEFCASCHIMKPQYASFKAGPHSELESCNDCHLPNTGFVRHYAADAFVGTRDLVEWNLNLIPEYTKATPRSQRWLQENCRRCHADVISGIHPPDDRWCWDCHRNVLHDNPGAPLREQGQPSAWESER